MSNKSDKTHEWDGMICTNCMTGFENSPSNSVSVLEFDFCPYCGSDELEYRKIEKSLGITIEEYIKQEN